MTGSPSRESFTPGQISASPSTTRGKSRMHQGARTDPCGGQLETVVPTATFENDELVVTDPAAPPIRPQRHVPNSIATIRRLLAVAIAATLQRCQCCTRRMPLNQRRNL